MRKVLLVLMSLVICGCSSVERFVMGTDYVDKKERYAEIEQAYQNGEITKAEYLLLKMENEQTYQSQQDK